MGFSSFGKDGKARKKKPAIRQPKIRWSALGLPSPEEASLSMETIRQQVSLLARHGLDPDPRLSTAPTHPSRGRNSVSSAKRPTRRRATE